MPENILYIEKELFQKIADGDQAAFHACFMQCHHHLHAVAIKYLRVNEAAEDAVQHVFLKLWQNRHKLAGIEKPLDYLFITCRNECLDALRRMARNHHNKRLLLEENPVWDVVMPDDELIKKEIRENVLYIVNDLPLQQREAWRMVKEKGMSYREAAAVMNLTPFTVKAYLARAVKKNYRQAKKPVCRLLYLTHAMDIMEVIF